MDSREMALYAAETLDDKKAFDITLINIGEKAAFADYFVIATGGNVRQIETLVDEVHDRFDEAEIPVKHVEGKKSSGWILMDYGDVVINIMSEDMRNRYNLEKLWADCETEYYERNGYEK